MEEPKDKQQLLIEDETIQNVSENKEPQKEKTVSGIKNFLFKDWKRDLKKMQIILLVIFYVVVIFGIISYFSGSFLGLRTRIFMDKVHYKNYSHIGPNFVFKYPDYFQIDNGEGKNYGNNYLTGVKLTTDSRTGCDVRLNNAGINFQKSNSEIAKALVGEISKSAKDFQFIKVQRFKIDGENAFSLEFSFTDPINSKVHLNQVMTGHGNDFYMIICGTGTYQYKFFESDFESFLDSIRWGK